MQKVIKNLKNLVLVGIIMGCFLTVKAEIKAEEVIIPTAAPIASVEPTPMLEKKKKVVIIGSSVAKGYGATDEYGWTKYLEDALEENKEFEVSNKSISGNNSQDVIDRFERDVTSEEPDIVVIGLSLANEKFVSASTATEKETICTKYKNNIEILCTKIREIKAIPIIGSCYPNNSYSLNDYKYILETNRFLESSNIATFDLMSNVDSGKGKWLNGTYLNSGHPNDTGHKLMFDSIPVSFFSKIQDNNNGYLSNNRHSYLKLKTGTIKNPIELYPQPFTSFTVSFQTVDLNLEDDNVMLSFDDGKENVSRVRTTRGVYSYRTANGEEIKSDVKNNVTEFSTITLAYNSLTGIMKFYVNGTYYGEVEQELDSPRIVIGGHLLKSDFTGSGAYRNIAFYRAFLNEEAIKDIHDGYIKQGALEIFAPCNDMGNKINNLAKTDSLIIKQGDINRITLNGASMTPKEIHKVTYVLKGGTNHKANPSVFREEDANISLKAPVRAGYIFKGWYKSADYTGKCGTIVPKRATDYKLYARWSKVSVATGKIISAKRASATKISLRYRKLSNVKGYEISYSRNKNFSSKIRIRHTSKTKITLSSLVKKRTYYVRVRGYKLDSKGKKVYGKYSRIKKVTL